MFLKNLIKSALQFCSYFCPDMQKNINIKNKRARFEYELLEKMRGFRDRGGMRGGGGRRHMQDDGE